MIRNRSDLPESPTHQTGFWGFRVLGFRVSGSGFRGVGFGVWGFGVLGK